MERKGKLPAQLDQANVSAITLHSGRTLNEHDNISLSKDEPKSVNGDSNANEEKKASAFKERIKKTMRIFLNSSRRNRDEEKATVSGYVFALLKNPLPEKCRDPVDVSTQRLDINVMLVGLAQIFENLSSTPKLNGLNFKIWKESLEILLGCMDLNLALRIDKPASTKEQPNTTNIEK
ncbi:cation/H(+) antiporter 15-like [Cucumis melo var. makuwa]|uniref:Cation/H(+) antiporter 15-like n=1 Tax=Cucumis melo var. makuwa TaxID=1194695 RepID=A0A5D3DEZ8_CUCMM|nr:cation/H(+) antiporter 15-like [Cucumis melo var. makuwa]